MLRILRKDPSHSALRRSVHASSFCPGIHSGPSCTGRSTQATASRHWQGVPRNCACAWPMSPVWSGGLPIPRRFRRLWWKAVPRSGTCQYPSAIAITGWNSATAPMTQEAGSPWPAPRWPGFLEFIRAREFWLGISHSPWQEVSPWRREELGIPIGLDFMNGCTKGAQRHGGATAMDRRCSMRPVLLSMERAAMKLQAEGCGPAAEVIRGAGECPGGGTRSGWWPMPSSSSMEPPIQPLSSRSAGNRFPSLPMAPSAWRWPSPMDDRSTPSRQSPPTACNVAAPRWTSNGGPPWMMGREEWKRSRIGFEAAPVSRLSCLQLWSSIGAVLSASEITHWRLSDILTGWDFPIASGYRSCLQASANIPEIANVCIALGTRLFARSCNECNLSGILHDPRRGLCRHSPGCCVLRQ